MMLKRTVLIILCVLITFTLVSMWAPFASIKAEESPQEPLYHDIDKVFSTYSPSTDYTTGGAIYTQDGGIAVRSVSTSQVTAGLSLLIGDSVMVDDSSAIVVNVTFYSNLTRTMKMDLVLDDTSVVSMQNGSSVYLAKDNEVVSSHVVTNNAFNNILGPSTGYKTGIPDEAYNQLVVPLASYGYAEGEQVGVSEIRFYAPPWSTGAYHKYVLTDVSVTDDFSVEAAFETRSVWTFENGIHTPYGDTEGHVDIRTLDPGQMWMEPSLDSSGTGITQSVVFKFPDALIGPSGLVDTDLIKGLTFSFTNNTDIAFNGHFKLYDDQGDSVANSNYMNLKTHKLTKQGIEASSNAKYFYPNTNTAGYSDVFIKYNFETTNDVTPQSTQSFYSPTGDLPDFIAPYFTFTYDNNQSLVVDSALFENIRILMTDSDVHAIRASSSEDVSVNVAKGFIGSDVIIVADDNGRTVREVTLNGQSLSDADIQSLFGPFGLTITVTGDMDLVILFDDETRHLVTITGDDHGTVTSVRDSFISGEPVLFRIEPETGYALDTLSINGTDRTDEVRDNALLISTGQEDLEILATFKEADTFTVEPGATSSLYNSYPGVIWAEFDAVNVQTVQGFAPDDPAQSIGVVIDGLDVAVQDDDVLVINVHSMINMWRTFQVRVNGVENASDMPYYLVDRYHTVHQKTGTGIITESSAPANTTNATLTLLKTEGFFGQIIIPLENFPGVETINSISIHTDIKDKSNARFNIGTISVTDVFHPLAGATALESVWTPAEDNWRPYEDPEMYGKVSFIRQGEISLQTVVANTYGYDALYVSMPSNMIGSDGYVDLEALGVIAIAIDVNNYNVIQHSMAIRVAGSDNPSLTDSTATLWQTSISNHPAQIVYPSGLVKSRNSAFIPYDDSGVFEGTIVIPLSATGFTNIGGFGDFPEQIQPVMRIMPGSMNDTEYENYDFEITGVRFITDASLYATHQITMSQIGGTLSGEIDGVQVTNASNNNVLAGTPVLFTVTPDRGYDITSVTYQMGEGDEITAALDTDNSIVINVTGELIIIAVCEEIDYVITYDLGGGENHPDNPSMYTVEDRTIVFEAPTREGYDFIGWFSGGVPITRIESGSIGDIELEARWAANAFIPRLIGWTSDNLVLSLVLGSLVVGALAGTTFVFIRKRNG